MSFKETINIKQPQTEIEYWETIESLGGVIWSENHAASHGRIALDADRIGELSRMQVQLVSELSKFGVISPEECPKDWRNNKPPKGKRWYWEWYYSMKKEKESEAGDE